MRGLLSGAERHRELFGTKCVTKDCIYMGQDDQDGHCEICYEAWVILRQWGKKKKPKKRTSTVEEEFSWEEYHASTQELMQLSLYLKNHQPTNNKCKICGKHIGNIGGIGYKCRCDGFYCGAHRLPESHQCTFDHSANDAEEAQQSKD